jgi:hypothetical protein
MWNRRSATAVRPVLVVHPHASRDRARVAKPFVEGKLPRGLVEIRQYHPVLPL